MLSRRERQIYKIYLWYMEECDLTKWDKWYYKQEAKALARSTKTVSEIYDEFAKMKHTDHMAKLGQQQEAEHTTSCSICKTPSIHEICLECETKYQAERHKVRAQILRAKRAGTPATLTLPEWIDTLNSLNWTCVYCQKNKYTVLEHFVPITQGGGTTKQNCVPSCVPCNSMKGDKHPDRMAPVAKQNGRR